ncbi:MAG: MFS transporter, partial [Propionibacteriaceae bacterium]|nr:MFS transporter [Propionibacteriaceae bacterium]
AVFMVPYVVGLGVMDRGAALMWLTLSSFFHVFTIPFFAWLSDRIGRKPVMIAGAVASAILIWPMFAMFNSGDPTLTGLAFLIGNPLIQAMVFGPLGAFLSEMFDTGSRYSGVSASYQIGSLIGAGTAPIVATNLVNQNAGTNNLAWFIVGAYAIAALAVFLSRTHKARQQSHAERFEEANRFQG